MAEAIENTVDEKTINKSEKQNWAKFELVRTKFASFCKKTLSFMVYFFCFILFPIFLLHSSLTLFFETNTDNLRQIKIAEMSEAMEYMDKYSNNKRYFHFVLSKISDYAQKVDNPEEFIKENIKNLKLKYPNRFEFFVWDNNGKLIKELCDKPGYNYVLNKLYEVLYQVSKDLKKDISTRVSNLDIVKKNEKMLRNFLGRIFIPENLKFPITNNINSGPFLTELGNNLPFVWYSINEKISFICFISNELLNDFSGLKKVANSLNRNSSDIIYGFSISPDFDKPVSSFPEKYENILSLALTTFENAGDSIFENEKAIVKMSMPQSAVRVFSYLHKTDENWNFEYKRDFWFGIFISILLAVYCFCGFWFLYKRHFFSIRWKLTVLFLLANLAPIAVLGFIAKGFLDSKRLSLKNEIAGELEKTLRELDARYNSMLDFYTSRINVSVQDISQKIGKDTVQQSEINSISELFNTFNASDIYLVASSGKILFNKRDESKATHKLEFMGSLGEAILAFANKKTINIQHRDVFSNMFNPEDAELIRVFLKNIASVVEFKFGDYFRIFYSYSFGDFLNFNHNYILIIFWEKEVFQNLFIKENFKTLYNVFTNTEFFVKSDMSDYFYGSEKYKERVLPILDRNLGMMEKNSGYVNIDNKRLIFVSIKGTNLKNWTLLAVTPEDSINKEINLIVIKTVVGALVSLLLTILIGHMLSLQFLKPIKNLGEAALAIGDRNFSYRVPIGDKDEFGHLNQVFNRVIEGLGDFEVARIVQESLFPGNHFDVGNFRIFGRSVVMTTLGGDYYDCFKINDDYQGIIIGDVAGHGIPAGLMMAMAKSSVLTASEEIKLDPAALTSRLHKMFFAIKNDKLKRMMTFQYFVLRVSDGHFRYTNAGHCFPVIIDSKNKTASFMDYIATPLGIGPRCRCKNQEFALLEGQSLVLYTDGIVEANNAEGEQYGYDRYKACLPEHYDPDPKVFYYNLYNKVYKIWSPKPDDDLTLILVNRE
jgi:hypothetical protein